jgi:hypothetical protein
MAVREASEPETILLEVVDWTVVSQRGAGSMAA